MSLNLAATGGNVLGQQSAAFGTVIYAVVPGRVGLVTRVSSFALVSAGTANSGYWMRPIGRAKLTVAKTTADTVITLDSDPSAAGNTIASGDQVVIAFADGTYRRCQVSSWNSGTKALTLSAVLPANAAAGAQLWNYGVFTDTDPETGLVHPLFISVASAQKVYTFPGCGIRGHLPGDPLLYYCPNATAITSLDYAEFGHTVE